MSIFINVDLFIDLEYLDYNQQTVFKKNDYKFSTPTGYGGKGSTICGKRINLHCPAPTGLKIR